MESIFTVLPTFEHIPFNRYENYMLSTYDLQHH